MNLIISDNDFVLKGQCYIRDDWSGRCYRLDEPSGFYTKAAREGGLVKKRISSAYYNECRKECLEACEPNPMAGGAA
jgi:hypothetical protein